MIRIASIALFVAASCMPPAEAADAIPLEPRYNPALYSKLESSIDSERQLLEHGMSFEEVQKLIHLPAAIPDHKFSYNTEEASVALSFASYSESGRRIGCKLIGFSVLSFGQ